VLKVLKVLITYKLTRVSQIAITAVQTSFKRYDYV